MIHFIITKDQKIIPMLLGFLTWNERISGIGRTIS